MPSRHHSTARSDFDRRRFLKLSSASVLLPGFAYGQSSFPSNPDVVTVGAGAAGIAAAHKLRERGVSYVHVEAAAQVGGRVITETGTFGMPYDVGAHWVQNETRNPYFERAKSSGGRFYRAPEEYGIYNESGPASEDEIASMWEAWEAVEGAISKAGKSRQDVAPASVAPTDNPWSQTGWFGIGSWEMGKDMDAFSCLDWWESAGSNDWYYADGYGTLVANHAKGLDVALNTAVTKITWGGDGVEVETTGGTIRAKAVILTVSTGVLAGEGIAFDPPLPVEKQESFNAISMGFYNHIALHFSEDIFGLGEDGYVLHKVDDSFEAFGVLVNASGTGLAYCDVGGDFARELELAGADTAMDFVVGKLRNLIGADVDKYLTKGTVSEWGKDPFVRGCYASAAPGGFPMREVLRQPVGDRIFFAGEACHEDIWATVGGADVTGTRVAEDLADLLV
ncbi:flavin monoamine oxidase family protein [Roseovarius rhodophyticola]|uniref:Tryptophan 2-monooxygenase n=1 Tax=Roseovarius rhodophyticola TaxID=3080827 RepID=A0ABZ2TG86_9RHOB|nr:FAD-dependent oxidoreductase [Roseovarius sp. W115]MDV2928971.1 FAD-dependent oxidoreductase [Roseovarius sp. W115]